MYRWCDSQVAKARQYLSPEQMLAAESEAEQEAQRLKVAAGVKDDGGKAAISLKNPDNLTKQQWKAGLGRVSAIFAQTGQIQMNKAQLLEICGEPKKSQTAGDKVHLYYQCKDGMIRMELNKDVYLLGGIASGTVNDY
jgi:hypothetical protein